jgi:hypothetical protein
VVLVFMEALGLEPPLTLVCSDLHLQLEGFPIEQGGDRVPFCPVMARPQSTSPAPSTKATQGRQRVGYPVALPYLGGSQLSWRVFSESQGYFFEDL